MLGPTCPPMQAHVLNSGPSRLLGQHPICRQNLRELFAASIGGGHSVSAHARIEPAHLRLQEKMKSLSLSETWWHVRTWLVRGRVGPQVAPWARFAAV